MMSEVAYPISNEVKMQWVTHEDVAAFAVEAPKRPEEVDANLEVCGLERLSGEEIAEHFGRALRREISFRPMPVREFGAHMDAAFGPSAEDDAVTAYENPETFSTDNNLSVSLERLPIHPTPLEGWVRQHATAFIAASSWTVGREAGWTSFAGRGPRTLATVRSSS